MNIQSENIPLQPPMLELLYYAAMCIIDPMHNLFLGTAKKMFKIWCENDILAKEKLQEVQERIENVEVVSNHGGFTASQWKNWVLYYSLFALCTFCRFLVLALFGGVRNKCPYSSSY